MSEWFDGSLAEEIEDSEYFESSSSFTGDVIVDMIHGSFSVAPFLWPQLANKVTVDWETDNISNGQCFLVGYDDSEILLNDNEPGVAKFKPSGNSTKYAGSWAQDYGAGVTTDQGTDSMSPEGISATVMADAHLSHAFQMLRDRTAKLLRFKLTPIDPSQPVVIKQPRFEYTLSAQRQTIYENAHQMAVIHPDGPGVRYGQMDTGTSGTIDNPPNVYDGATRPNAIDWRIYHRLSVQGIAHDDGLTTELANDRDAFEGQSVGNERNGSFGFLLPNNGESANWFVALVAALAEIPPLAMLPRRERNENTWEEDGGFCQHAWVWGQEPDYFVNPQEPPQLRADDLTTVWTSTGSAVSGWALSSHTHAVDNSEVDFGIWAHDVQFAETLRPWRGHYMVLTGRDAGGGITYVVGRDLTHYRASIDGDGYVVTERADNALGWSDVLQAFTATQIHYSITRRGNLRLRLCYSDGTNVFARYSVDGFNFGSATSHGNGTRMISVDCEDGGYFLYYLDGTDIKVKQYDSGDNQIGSTVVAIAGVDDVPFDAFASSPGSNGFRVVLHCVMSGVQTQKTSPDGINFS